MQKQLKLNPVTSWKAAQGDQTAQRVAAAHYRANGDTQRADFYDAKASGDPSFTFENWLAKQLTERAAK